MYQEYENQSSEVKICILLQKPRLNIKHVNSTQSKLMRIIYFILKVNAKIADVEFKGKNSRQTGISENNLNRNKDKAIKT